LGGSSSSTLIGPCGCRSEFDRLFGCRGTKVFIHGNDTDPLHSDDGSAIRFMFETPWIDFEKRSAKKQSRYLAMDSDGTAQYQVSLYVDRIYDDVFRLDTDLSANPSIIYDDFTYPTTPEIVAQLTAGRGPGWSRGPQPYGGGRRTSRAGLIGFPAEFDICKVRVFWLSHRTLQARQPLDPLSPREYPSWGLTEVAQPISS
jgi:hypothetical protein